MIPQSKQKLYKNSCQLTDFILPPKAYTQVRPTVDQCSDSLISNEIQGIQNKWLSGFPVNTKYVFILNK